MCHCPVIMYELVEAVVCSAQLSSSGPLKRACAIFDVVRWRARDIKCGSSKAGGGLRWLKGIPGCWFSHRRPVSFL